MKKILVTTDFSASSRSALYFAIQLASQAGYSLTFFHAYHVLVPTAWNEKVFDSFEKSEASKIEKKLQRMVEFIYKKSGCKKSDYQCVISRSAYPEKVIMEYAKVNEADFICISRRGEASNRNIFGTTTSGLINKSTIPVIAVPPKYRGGKITKVLYASDLVNFEKEINKVVDFAKPLKTKLELLHFKLPSDVSLDPKMIENASKRFSGQEITMHIREFDFSESLVKNLDKAISNSNPSVLIMFTQQHRDFFSRLFLPGSTPSYAFKASVPVLVFPKESIIHSDNRQSNSICL
jgi:nucleotide-binding universal stress UspA family protein